MLQTAFDWLKRLVFGRARPTPGVSPFAADTGPSRLLILRHAEKTGEKSDRRLSPAGQKRAHQLVSYIPQQFGRPDFLVAASNSKKSRRPRDTLEPLASALGLGIIDEIDDEDVDQVVEHLSDGDYAGAFGIISWRHSEIAALMVVLGAPVGSYPDPWPESVFDLILDVTYAKAGAVSVRTISQPF